MRGMRRCLVWLALVVPMMVAPAPVRAAEGPVALVTSLEGVAGVRVYSELRAGASIALGAAGRMGLLHYRSCRTATVEGGVVSVDEAGFSTAGGRVVAEGVGRCPGRISIADGRVNFTNGLMLRTTPNEAALPVGGLVVFAGARADDVTSVTFAKPGQGAVALPVRGGQVRWEMVPVALVEGGGVLTIAGRQALHQAIPVRAGRDAGALVIEVAN